MLIKCIWNEFHILKSFIQKKNKGQIGFSGSDLEKQLNTKMKIFVTYIQGILNFIDSVKRSQRLINLSSKQRNTKGKYLETKYFYEKTKKEIYEESCLEINYCLEFNHLTRWYDLGSVIDQSLLTLENAFKGSENSGCLNSRSEVVKINLSQVKLGRIINELFKKDKEFLKETGESAIKILENQKNFQNVKYKIYTNDEIPEYKNIKINELIREIDKNENNDKSFHYDILFEDANINEINKYFFLLDFPSNINPISNQTIYRINIFFDGLHSAIAHEKLDKIKAKSFDIKFTIEKLAILDVMEKNPELEKGVFYKNDNQLSVELERQELLMEFEKLESDNTCCFIEFENLSKNDVENIIKSFSEKNVFALRFKDIYHFDNNLKDCEIICSFDELDQKSAKIIIELLRKHDFDFSLEFCNLSNKNVEYILKHARREEECIRVIRKKRIQHIFVDHPIPALELSEFISKGMEFIIETKEREMPFRGVVFLL